jgi:putative spermidine/putrescine transport system permease protein
VILPFWTSVLVRAYAWLVLLQRRGLVNQTLMDLGIIDQPLTLMHNTTGTVIGTLHVMLPFMVLPLYSVMKKSPRTSCKRPRALAPNPSTPSAGSSCRWQRRGSWPVPSWCSSSA